MKITLVFLLHTPRTVRVKNLLLQYNYYVEVSDYIYCTRMYSLIHDTFVARRCNNIYIYIIRRGTQHTCYRVYSYAKRTFPRVVSEVVRDSLAVCVRYDRNIYYCSVHTLIGSANPSRYIYYTPVFPFQ